MKKPNWKKAAEFWKWKFDHKDSPISAWAVFRFKKNTQKEILSNGFAK